MLNYACISTKLLEVATTLLVSSTALVSKSVVESVVLIFLLFYLLLLKLSVKEQLVSDTVGVDII